MDTEHLDRGTFIRCPSADRRWRVCDGRCIRVVSVLSANEQRKPPVKFKISRADIYYAVCDLKKRVGLAEPRSYIIRNVFSIFTYANKLRRFGPVHPLQAYEIQPWVLGNTSALIGIVSFAGYW